VLEPEENDAPDALAILIAGGLVARHHHGLEPSLLLRCLRRQAGLTQTEVAALAGVRQPRVSDVERGRAEPRW